ncbi:MAG: OB-fold nucleic acid binding domain-containing protein [Phycisphaerales bacterium]
MHLTRQQALWNLHALRDGEAPLFDHLDSLDRAGPAHGDDSPADDSRADDPRPPLPPIPGPRQVNTDYHAVGLSLKAHPLSFVREHLAALGVTENGVLADPARCPAGLRVKVAGIVLVRQRPGTASGILFMTLEDETGVANLIVRPHVFERFRRAARHSHAVLCSGVVERQGAVVHVMAKHIRSLDALLADPHGALALSRDFH